MTFLLHKWLLAECHDGLSVPEDDGNGDGDESWVLSGAALMEKIHLIKHDARRQLLLEMADPTLRIWLIFLAICGESSVLRFLNYTQNDGLGIAFKAPRVVRSRISYLDGLASAASDPLVHEDFTSLRGFVTERSSVYTSLESVRGIMRKAAGSASYYFQGEKGADSKPREMRALRWLRHPALLVLGLMDEKGDAVRTARELMDMAKQGLAGICQAMLPFMPDGASVAELQDAVRNATDGVGVIFQPDSMAVISQLAKQPAATKLADLPGHAAKELHALLWRVGSHVMVGNGQSETGVKTLEHDLHPTQRRTQSYATMLTAARHRGPVRWLMTQEDYAWAARELRQKAEATRTTKRSLGLQLKGIDLKSERAKHEEPQEETRAADEEEEPSEGINPDEKSLTMPSVKVSSIRNVLAPDTVVELLWAISPEGERDCHPALITKMKARVIFIRWLKPVGPIEDGILVINPEFTEQSWEIKFVSNSLVDVEEPPPQERSAEIAEGTRW